jgi:CheY-like chemotaxis protein
VLILDVIFGRSASGLRLLDQLGADPERADTAVIVCTADNVTLRAHEDVLRERGIRVPGKPFDVQDLLVLVNDAIVEADPAMPLIARS